MSAEFVQWCCELLAPAGPVRSRRMFGAYGLYVDDLFVAIVDDEQLFLKGDETSKPQYQAAGCAIFTYSKADGETGQMNYFSAPAEAMESPPLMAPWLRLAMESALRARASKAKPAARKPPAKAKEAAETKPGQKAPAGKAAARRRTIC